MFPKSEAKPKTSINVFEPTDISNPTVNPVDKTMCVVHHDTLWYRSIIQCTTLLKAAILIHNSQTQWLIGVLLASTVYNVLGLTLASIDDLVYITQQHSRSFWLTWTLLLACIVWICYGMRFTGNNNARRMACQEILLSVTTTARIILMSSW